jgi:hypothetical protein
VSLNRRVFSAPDAEEMLLGADEHPAQGHAGSGVAEFAERYRYRTLNLSLASSCEFAVARDAEQAVIVFNQRTE